MSQPKYGVRIFLQNGPAYGTITWYATEEAQEKALKKAKKLKNLRYAKKVTR